MATSAKLRGIFSKIKRRGDEVFGIYYPKDGTIPQVVYVMSKVINYTRLGGLLPEEYSAMRKAGMKPSEISKKYGAFTLTEEDLLDDYFYHYEGAKGEGSYSCLNDDVMSEQFYTLFDEMLQRDRHEDVPDGLKALMFFMMLFKPVPSDKSGSEGPFSSELPEVFGYVSKADCGDDALVVVVSKLRNVLKDSGVTEKDIDYRLGIFLNRDGGIAGCPFGVVDDTVTCKDIRRMKKRGLVFDEKDPDDSKKPAKQD
jgi:hypothetical protein